MTGYDLHRFRTVKALFSVTIQDSIFFTIVFYGLYLFPLRSNVKTVIIYDKKNKLTLLIHFRGENVCRFIH